MSIFLRILLACQLLVCTQCASGAGEVATAAGETPAAEAQEQAPPAEVRPAEAALIVIAKESMTIAVYDFRSRLLAAWPMACGRGIGNKEKPGDMKTPEGVFTVQQIQDASTWSHDFGDGKGVIKGAYGSHFIRLKTPGHSGIGIHGTHDPASIGTRASEGCIRLNNADLLELVKLVYVGMPVVITTSEQDSAVACKMPAEAKKGPALTSRKAPAVAPAQTEAKKEAKKEDTKPAVKAASQQKTHTVKAGESLSTIAEKYGMSVTRLRQLNPSIQASKINTGQKLVIEQKTK